MGARDVITNQYFDTKERVSDLLNGFVYRGRALVKPEQIKKVNNVLTRVEHGKQPQESAGSGDGARMNKRMSNKQVQTVTVDVV
ncbi:MAG: hypothetical protein IJ794_03800, partial [Lachnospiraceae bacterium]|nr:hypothetical protein [Lachnospiraceae bacterium]